jgi:hypothetical protein
MVVVATELKLRRLRSTDGAATDLLDGSLAMLTAMRPGLDPG